MIRGRFGFWFAGNWFLGLLSGCLGPVTEFKQTQFIPLVQATILPIKQENICIDLSFDDEDHRAIILSVQDWNKALNGDLQLTIDNGMCVAWIMPIAIHEILSNQPAQALAFTDITRVIYLVRQRISSETMLSDVIRHELGHLLGVGHHPNDQGLMGGHFSRAGYAIIDDWSLQQARKAITHSFRFFDEN
jgi:hypothetical protein